MAYSQENRYLYLTTPAGQDKLLLRSFVGQEGVSKLFSFRLSLWAENATVIDFAQLIGAKVSFGVTGEQPPARDLDGIVVDFAQSDRGEEFTDYEMTVVPEVWKLTKRFGSRIFQHLTVPDILQKVLTGFQVSYEIQGTFEPREYCTQYQESDFDFAARLMEEEGIYYYFTFSPGAHTLVVTNKTQHPSIPGEPKIVYDTVEGGQDKEERILSWRKVQTWGSGQYTLWDHHFQLPHKHLEADEPVMQTVTAGKIQHKLHLAGNEKMEIYENPGRYAQRFDGIDKTGGEKPGDLQKIFQDNKRTVRIRAEEIETPMVLIRGQASHRQLTPGHKFTLQRHFNADDQYMVLEVSHTAVEGGFRAGSDGVGEDHYQNAFTCLPDAVAYRPPRVTRRPLVTGPVSAVVVGPPGEEIFTDKYGRVKVQFHWDREGKLDADSSCWLRTTTPWAGRNWGMVQIPRIGQEVIVDFLEGDADRPIIVGSVYNADQMPPYKLPDKKMVSGWKSNSTPGGGGYNEMSMNDTKGSEMVIVHAQKDMATTVEHDDSQTIHNNRTIKVDGTHTENITKETKITIEEGPYTLDVLKNTHTHYVKKDVNETYDANQNTTVTNTITITAGDEILLHCGDSMMSLKKDGTIVISGKDISVLGSATVKIGVSNQNVVCDVQKVATSGAAIDSNAVGMHTISGAVVKIN